MMKVPSDYELLLMWHRDHPSLNSGQAARRIADKTGLSHNAIRGRLSRANKVDENHAQIAKVLTTTRQDSPSEMRQKEIVEASWQRFNQAQSEKVEPAVGVFISDKHNPYHRTDAWELLISILKTIPHIDYISVQNDWNDWHGWSRWEDKRPYSQKWFSADMENTDRLEMSDYRRLKALHPEAELVAIMGNHDRWMYNDFRRHMKKGAEKVIADRMERFYDLGVLQFSRGFHDNFLWMAPDLVWLHGTWHAKLASTNARNAVQSFVVDGTAANVVFGHSHRGSITPGHQFGYPGIVVVNNHSLRKNTNVEFLRLGFESRWTLGFTVCYFRPDTRETSVESVEFKKSGRHLVAHYHGQVHKTLLEEQCDES